MTKWILVSAASAILLACGCAKSEPKPKSNPPGGIHISAPGVEISVDSDGASVDAPNVSIRTDEDGTDVSGPNVDIKARRGN